MANLISKVKEYFPKFQIKFKDQSLLMKILGKLLFFNPRFMTSYTTTIGNTIYAPSEKFITDNPENFKGIIIHECTHMYDSKRLNILFTLGYLFPQILSLPVLLLLFVLSWKIVLPIFVLLLLPLPAPWRAYFERRAYFVHMYAMKKLFGTNPIILASHFSNFFKDGSYYWMWVFGMDTSFNKEALNILVETPASAEEPNLHKMVNDLIEAAK